MSDQTIIRMDVQLKSDIGAVVGIVRADGQHRSIAFDERGNLHRFRDGGMTESEIDRCRAVYQAFGPIPHPRSSDPATSCTDRGGLEGTGILYVRVACKDDVIVLEVSRDHGLTVVLAFDHQGRCVRGDLSKLEPRQRELINKIVDQLTQSNTEVAAQAEPESGEDHDGDASSSYAIASTMDCASLQTADGDMVLRVTRGAGVTHRSVDLGEDDARTLIAILNTSMDECAAVEAKLLSRDVSAADAMQTALDFIEGHHHKGEIPEQMIAAGKLRAAIKAEQITEEAGL